MNRAFVTMPRFHARRPRGHEIFLPNQRKRISKKWLPPPRTYQYRHDRITAHAVNRSSPAVMLYHYLLTSTCVVVALCYAIGTYATLRWPLLLFYGARA